MLKKYSVASRVGAWIETSIFLTWMSAALSHPVWVRGLKLLVLQFYSPAILSHPVWVRGLKHNDCIN